jgi:membrane-associated protein
MDRRKFIVWSLVGALTWVASILLLGYFVGSSVPWLAKNVDYLILGLLALSVIPIAIEWWRHRDDDDDDDSSAENVSQQKSKTS